MADLWQLYDEQGRPIEGEGTTKAEGFSRALLHAASHVWIWRRAEEDVEILLQRRAPDKRTWPDRLDISAAGHIDLGETPLIAAVRETSEELGIEIPDGNLIHCGVRRAYIETESGDVENEFQFLYITEMPAGVILELGEEEVSSTEWKPLDEFHSEMDSNPEAYVPHGPVYFDTIYEAIMRQVSRTRS